MNRQRRKKLNTVKEAIENLKEALEYLAIEEEEYRDNMPENLHESERYETADNACDALREAVGNLSAAIENIGTAVEE